MLKIAVCDDEIKIRENIIQLIRKQVKDVIITEFSSGKDMLASNEYYDITFLDIAMEELSGIEVAKEIRTAQEQKGLPKSIIIFVTGYREYMEDAFDVNAYHYLVKPIDESKLLDVLNRATKEVIAGRIQTNRYIILKTYGVQKKVMLRDIYYIESNNKKVIIHTRDGNIEVYGKMDEFEKQLGIGFYRCHRCFLLNMEKISAYSMDSIHLINGESVLLAQKKYSEFVKTYMRYAKSGGIVNV